MARKTTKTNKTTGTRTRRTLADRIQGFTLEKLAKMKVEAESVIRTIAAEGLRRQEAHKVLQDTSAIDTSKVAVDPTEPVVQINPYAGTPPNVSTAPVSTNGRSVTTSP